MEVLSDEYINPFSTDLNKVKLVNLRSGAPVVDNCIYMYMIMEIFKHNF